MSHHSRRAFIKGSALAAGCALTGCLHVAQSRPQARKPNIILILADDLGLGDLGAYGQQRIETCNIDRLCRGGMRFTTHYSGSPVYAPDLMFDEIRAFVSANRARPFFLYWSTPIPHVALQAPQRWVDHYVRKFGDEPPYGGKAGYFPHRHPHACYAAMVSYLDEQVGLLVGQLKALGLYEDTLILFSSDNGPSFNGGTDSPWFNSGGPFKSEAGWGKGSLREGGIRVPLIAAWPGRIRPGSQSDHPCAFWDVLPTLCDVAGAGAPDDTDGISFAPTLFGQSAQREHAYLYWEYPEAGGHQALRQGRWKALRSGLKRGGLKTALYDLEADPREERDVAARHPETVARLERLMREARVPPALDTFKLKALGD